MLEKLKKVEEKFDFISAELCKSEVVSDMELYKKYMQELKHLSPIVENTANTKRRKITPGRRRACSKRAARIPSSRSLHAPSLKRRKRISSALSRS